jgi:hypothetical protein
MPLFKILWSFYKVKTPSIKISMEAAVIKAMKFL